MKQAWDRYQSLVPFEGSENGLTYIYPVTDEATDSRLEQQDPGKIGTEQTLIARFLDWDWETATNFGCGTGAHFQLFDREEKKNCLLIGIDKLSLAIQRHLIQRAKR
jgi:hypothetical protein